MMATRRAAFRVVASLGASTPSGQHPLSLLCVAGVATGVALPPDIDEPGSTVAHLAEPVTGFVALMTQRVTGGNRIDTHSLLAVMLAVGGAWAVALFRTGHDVSVVSIVIVAGVLAVAIRGLIPRLLRPGHLIALVVDTLLAYVFYPSNALGWLPLAIGAGWRTRLVGDMVTSSGAPPSWTGSKHHFALPFLDQMNSWRERLIGVPLLVVVVAVAWAPFSAVIGTAR